MQAGVLAVVLAGTVVALYLRPWGARDWQVAIAGGLVAWWLGPLGLRGGLEVVGDAANVLAFFLGLMLVAAGAKAAGLYARVAQLLGRRWGRERVGLVLLTGAAVTAILSNDATPLVLTPAIFVAGAASSRTTTEAAFAATFIADGASLLLPVSNPVNLLFYERFAMTFERYLVTVGPAALAGAAALGAVTWLRAGPSVSTGEAMGPRQAEARSTRAALVVVAGLAGGYIAGGLMGWPLGLVTLVGGGAMALAARSGGPFDWRGYRRHIAPGVLLFVAGLLLLVENVVASGALDWLAGLLGWMEGLPLLAALAGAAVVAAVLANVMNNWPAALLLAATISSRPGEHEAVVVGTLIGATIGANFTVVGSLSTVFWLNLARQHGAAYGPVTYARRAFWPTAAGMTAAVAVGALALRLG